jgi:hypothetical protein
MGLPPEESLCKNFSHVTKPPAISENDLTYFIENVGELAGSKLLFNQPSEVAKLRNMCELQS